MNNIHPTAIILPGVELGDNIKIGAFCIIGEQPQNENDELNTIIRDGAVIRSHTVIYAGNTIGKNLNTGHHVSIREKNEIGNDVSIGTYSCIEHHVFIGNRVRLHSQVFIPEYSILKDESWIGPNVVLTNALYPKGKNVKKLLNGVIVEENAKIGANATILPGKKIGRDALIGAGCVVTADVEPRSVVIGNPARNISSIETIEEYRK